jgi:hypothetical protein
MGVSFDGLFKKLGIALVSILMFISAIGVLIIVESNGPIVNILLIIGMAAGVVAAILWFVLAGLYFYDLFKDIFKRGRARQ